MDTPPSSVVHFLGERDFPRQSAIELLSLAKVVAKRCLGCRSCQHSCDFLFDTGTPGDIARAIIEGKMIKAYSCNLCGLCSELCPEKLPVRDMLFLLRRKMVEEEKVRFTPLSPSSVARMAWKVEGFCFLHYPGRMRHRVLPRLSSSRQQARADSLVVWKVRKAYHQPWHGPRLLPETIP